MCAIARKEKECVYQARADPAARGDPIAVISVPPREHL